MLAPHPSMDQHPSWSPDGREIAFSSYRGGHRDVWVVPADGGDARQITDEASEDFFSGLVTGMATIWSFHLTGKT